MSKIKLFLNLYRDKKSQNTVLVILLSMLAAVVSMVLFTQDNNRILLETQITKTGFDISTSVYAGSENILGMIALAADLVGAAGGGCLIVFRNQVSEKSQVLFRLFGMKAEDLILKAALDSVLLAVPASLAGCAAGYGLFCRFTSNILQTSVWLRFVSFTGILVFFKTICFLVTIVFLGNLYADVQIYEKPAAEVLYEREGMGEEKKFFKKSFYILSAYIFINYTYASLVFHISGEVLRTSTVLFLLLSFLLFLAFRILFGKMVKRQREKQRVKQISDLSLCFLCSRSKRDALLAIVVSLGTLLLCITANIRFNLAEMIRNAYRDNMGYSSLVRVNDYKDKNKIKLKLDSCKVDYTYAYSKLMDYSELNIFANSYENGLDMGLEVSASQYESNSEIVNQCKDAPERREGNKFYALVVEEQTDGNRHFAVPKNGFLAENRFIDQCGLVVGVSTSLFGKEITFLGTLEDDQYLGLVSYNFIVNKSDWNLGIDDSWDVIFLVDLTLSQEKWLKEELKDMGCQVESASGLIDAVMELLSDYMSLIFLLAGMILLVTAAVFYTVIRADLAARKTELYLYRIFGASFSSAQAVIFREYVAIALFASLAVSFAVLVCGELYFYFGLKKHFMLSLPVSGLTMAAAVLFVFLCCNVAGWIHAKNTGLEAIRDC